jgi:uncharacterized membrane protein
MKKKHVSSLKFHTTYSVVLALVFVIIVIFVRDIALIAAMVFLFLYVAGNGIIHSKKNELTRDTILEYIIISIIVLVVIIGSIF